ncbi:LOW QUALITY PROTEIN: G2 and S phase-expressed protein 1 [Antechinus flavipes]|uniref:LOW QUALITY PROTEIN: G2 and S phase-expressed protein 1 n=1 Tax=Antechinus flavipes TaxID=38775 RepID=UPI0022367231|nr:LOW QUALITY PROTEIN: G2 and S phase-expressed protein 1 [Antechinus flavipes]
MEEGEEGSVRGAGEGEAQNDLPLLIEEKFDFDLSLSSSSANEDDEVFFGPVGHRERCVAASLELQGLVPAESPPWSPLVGEQFQEIFREARLLALQIKSSSKKAAPEPGPGEDFVQEARLKLDIFERGLQARRSPLALKRETYCVPTPEAGPVRALSFADSPGAPEPAPDARLQSPGAAEKRAASRLQPPRPSAALGKGAPAKPPPGRQAAPPRPPATGSRASLGAEPSDQAGSAPSKFGARRILLKPPGPPRALPGRTSTPASSSSGTPRGAKGAGPSSGRGRGAGGAAVRAGTGAGAGLQRAQVGTGAGTGRGKPAAGTGAQAGAGLQWAQEHGRAQGQGQAYRGTGGGRPAAGTGGHRGGHRQGQACSGHRRVHGLPCVSWARPRELCQKSLRVRAGPGSQGPDSRPARGLHLVASGGNCRPGPQGAQQGRVGPGSCPGACGLAGRGRGAGGGGWGPAALTLPPALGLCSQTERGFRAPARHSPAQAERREPEAKPGGPGRALCRPHHPLCRPGQGARLGFPEAAADAPDGAPEAELPPQPLPALSAAQAPGARLQSQGGTPGLHPPAGGRALCRSLVGHRDSSQPGPEPAAPAALLGKLRPEGRLCPLLLGGALQPPALGARTPLSVRRLSALPTPSRRRASALPAWPTPRPPSRAPPRKAEGRPEQAQETSRPEARPTLDSPGLAPLALSFASPEQTAPETPRPETQEQPETPRLETPKPGTQEQPETPRPETQEQPETQGQPETRRLEAPKPGTQEQPETPGLETAEQREATQAPSEVRAVWGQAQLVHVGAPACPAVPAPPPPCRPLIDFSNSPEAGPRRLPLTPLPAGKGQLLIDLFHSPEAAPGGPSKPLPVTGQLIDLSSPLISLSPLGEDKENQDSLLLKF